MTSEQLGNFYNAQPFRPFVIHRADGRTVPVASSRIHLDRPQRPDHFRQPAG
jgi:hypothetical protein